MLLIAAAWCFSLLFVLLVCNFPVAHSFVHPQKDIEELYNTMQTVFRTKLERKLLTSHLNIAMYVKHFSMQIFIKNFVLCIFYYLQFHKFYENWFSFRGVFQYLCIYLGSIMDLAINCWAFYSRAISWKWNSFILIGITWLDFVLIFFRKKTRSVKCLSSN